MRITDIYHPALSDRPTRRTVSRVAPVVDRTVDQAVSRALLRTLARIGAQQRATEAQFSSI